jgi:hypothetical protein
MALNLDAVGQTLGPMTKSYTWKDVVFTPWESARARRTCTTATKRT